MTTTPQPPSSPPVLPPSEKKGASCWLVGCSGCLILLLLVLGISGFLVWKVWNEVKIEPFTPVELASNEQEKAEDKFKSLEQLDASSTSGNTFQIPTEGLRLSESEVNYWLSTSQNDLADSVRVEFDPGILKLDLRIGDGENLRLPVSATLAVSYINDKLDIRVIDLDMGKWSLPKKVKTELKNEKLVEAIWDDPNALDKFESTVERIEVFKDEILIIPRKNMGK